jgi:transcriptional regulator GlxA family with amidase domain
VLKRHPCRVDLRNGLGSVVFSMLATVSRQHGSLDSYEFTRSCSTLVDLLVASTIQRGGLPDTLDSVEQAVRQYVARHAHNPELTPTLVAKSLGWSVRQIQLALQQAGTTTSDLIRTARVNHAADLLRLSPPTTTITSIAFDSGFRSMSTFESVFKQYFGLTPREVRLSARQPIGDVVG